MPPRNDRLKPVLLLGDGVGQIDDELLSERWTGLFRTLAPKIRVFNLTTPPSRPVRRPPVEKFPLLRTPFRPRAVELQRRKNRGIGCHPEERSACRRPQGRQA